MCAKWRDGRLGHVFLSARESVSESVCDTGSRDRFPLSVWRRREVVPWKKSLIVHKGEVVQIFRAWDTNGDGELCKSEWRRGIRTLGFDAPQKEVCANSLTAGGCPAMFDASLAVPPLYPSPYPSMYPSLVVPATAFVSS